LILDQRIISKDQSRISGRKNFFFEKKPHIEPWTIVNAQNLLYQCYQLVYNTNMTLSNNSSLRNVKKKTISI